MPKGQVCQGNKFVWQSDEKAMNSIAKSCIKYLLKGCCGKHQHSITKVFLIYYIRFVKTEYFCFFIITLATKYSNHQVWSYDGQHQGRIPQSGFQI